MSRVAVVTIAHGRHDHLERQHRTLAAGDRRPDDYVVVAMDDTDLAATTVGGLRREVVRIPRAAQGLPLAAARNLGARTVLDAGAEQLVMLDVDCLAGPGLVTGYVEALDRDPGTVWSGPVTYLPPAPPGGYDLDRLEEAHDPHPARPAPAVGELVASTRPELFWSLSFAITGPAWRSVGGFCEDYEGYGGEDTDFARLLVAHGLGLGWAGTPRAFHQFHEVERPPVRHLEAILRNGAVYAARWGEWPMTGWLESFEELGLVERVGDGWRRRS